ncbi:MAG: MBL fold metallo-hydrolase, partial [Candidatus Micrarchaeota archaeon]
MELRFLGACREVGKSCVAVETQELRVAMDCGLKVHDHNEYPPLENLGFDACILSHAHLDHSGSIPVLYKQANIPTFCTFPTIPLATLLLEDSEKIAQLNGNQLPYRKADAHKLYQKFTPIPYNSEYEFYDGSSFELYDAGHIPGSSGVLFSSKEGGKKKTVFYTGDFNYSDTRLLAKAKLPDGRKEKIDALVIESTYAFREHTDRRKLENAFIGKVKDCLADGFTALVPSFAVGRSQEILLVLHALLNSKEKIYLDGMGRKVVAILSDYPSYVKNDGALSGALEKTSFVKNNAERKKILGKPCVILTTSGMLDGGPVLHYIQELGNGGKAKIFLTGFQVAGTNGRALMEGKA